MAFYRDARTLYACLDALFEHMQRQAPQSTRGLSDARFSVRFTFSAPRAQVFFDGRPRPFRTVFGDSPVRADLEVELAGDTFHEVMLGRLNVLHAVGGGLIKVRGPAFKVYPLRDMLFAGREFYPIVLQENNLAARFGKDAAGLHVPKTRGRPRARRGTQGGKRPR